jgi:hypothetical protein
MQLTPVPLFMSRWKEEKNRKPADTAAELAAA